MRRNLPALWKSLLQGGCILAGASWAVPLWAGPEYNPTISRIIVHQTRLVQIDITEELTAGSLDPGNYTISGSGRGSLAEHPDVVEMGGDYQTFRLKWNSGSMVSRGDIIITVSPSLMDAGGLPFVPPYNQITAFGGGVINTGIIRVDPAGGDDANEGEDWAHAKRSVHSAIDSLPFGEIWLKQGTYTGVPDARHSAFRLKGGVAIYGGFAGTESTREERLSNPALTVLDGQGVAWHVVLATNLQSLAVLDGVTITGGHSPESGDASDLNGAGIYSEAQYTNATKLNNCLIRGNTAKRAGGGIYGVGLQAANCRFEENTSLGEGGGAAMVWTIDNCVFVNNTAVEAGGGGAAGVDSLTSCVFINNTGNWGGGVARCVTVQDCTFIGNVAAERSGGGLDSAGVGRGSIVRCRFFNNVAAQSGGGAFISQQPVSDSEFGGNMSARGGGIHAMSTPYFWGSSTFMNCKFSGNRATSGGAIWIESGYYSIQRSMIVGNSAAAQGGGVFLHTPVHIENCLISGNEAGYSGGGIHFASTLRTEVNLCTIDSNRSLADGGGFSTAGELTYAYGAPVYRAARPIFAQCLITNNGPYGGLQLPGLIGQANTPSKLERCLFFGNEGADFHSEQNGATATGANELNALYFSTGVFGADPLYRMDTSDSGVGTWNAVTYDASQNRTTFTDAAGLIGSSGSLVGRIICPNTNSSFQAIIVQNATDTVTVVGDFVTERKTTAGDGWRLMDYRLSAGSPAINVGTLNSSDGMDIVGTKRPQGGKTDIGAYEYVP